MLKDFILPFRKLDRRVKVSIAATGLAGFGNRMTTSYDQLYAANLGADPLNIGLLTAISQTFSAIIAVPMGWAIGNYSVKKIMLLNVALFAIHLAIMGLARDWLMLIPAYIISTRLLRMGPLSDIIFVTAVEPQRRVTIIGLSRVLWNVLNVFAPMTAAFIVASSGGITAQGIRPLYYIELVLAIIVLLLVARHLPPTLGRVDRKDGSGSNRTSIVQDYRGAFKGERYLRRWVVLRAVQTFSASLAAPFTALWLVEVKGATPLVIGILGSTSLIVSLVLQIPAGRLADRIGRRRVYFALRPLSYVGTLLAILAQSPELLILAGLLGGYASSSGTGDAGISGVAQPLFVTWWWESIPEEKRGRFFGIEGLFGLAAIPASILGGILWQEGYVMQVLLIPIIVEVIVVMPMLATVADIVRPEQ